MRRFRQWLTETQDHMTESPDGKWALYAEALADIEAAVKAREKEFEVELSNLALAHEADRKPLVGELIEKQKYILELEAEVKEKEKIASGWQRKADEAITKLYQAKEQIAHLSNVRDGILWAAQEKDKQIAALNDALSGRDNVIERLKGYLVNKKTDIAEKVEYIATLAAENKRQAEEIVKLKEKLISRREWHSVDATPNGDLPVRILAVFIEDGLTTDNTTGFTPENPLCKLMNEAQEKRNIILRKAIDALKQGKEVGDASRR